MNIYYWCPFISNVATTTAVLNSIDSLNRFSKKKIECKIINIFKEWNVFKKELINLKINLIDLNIPLDIKYLPRLGFLKSRLTYIIAYFFSIFKLHSLIKKDNPEFLIIHLLTSIPLSLLIFFNYDTKFILRISGLPKLNIWRSFLWKLSGNKIDKIFCPTLLTKNLLIKKKIFDEKKIFVVKDPVINVKNIKKKLKQNIDELHDEKYIVTVGRLSKQKNFKFLINNFKFISQRYPELHLLIIGEGEEKAALNNLVKKNNLENKIFLLGKKNNIYPYLHKALFFILTSDWEDPGFVILESMFARKIVFSSNCDNGPKEIIEHKKNGFLYKVNDIKDFNNKFDEVMKLVNSDKKDKKNIIFNGLKKAGLYSLFSHFKDIKLLLN